MLQSISSKVFSWSEIHGIARNMPYPWNSYIINLPEESALILVDPLAMSEEEEQEIEQIGIPTHILLTCDHHLRESETYRKRWNCQIFVNEVEANRYEIFLDRVFQDKEPLFKPVDLITILDGKYPETAFLVRDDKDVLIVGDLLAGGRMDSGIPDGEMAISGPRYVPDLTKARKSLYRLLDYDFEVMCFAHGTPVFKNPKDKLKNYLDSDQIWEALEKFKQQRGPKIAE